MPLWKTTPSFPLTDDIRVFINGCRQLIPSSHTVHWDIVERRIDPSSPEQFRQPTAIEKPACYASITERLLDMDLETGRSLPFVFVIQH